MLNRTCQFSECRQYRYTLWRDLSDDEHASRAFVMFIGLNPSTADEVKDDPTIRRCALFAKAWGYSGLVMTNLFAFRATRPKAMKEQKDPVGPENNYWLKHAAQQAGLIVAAWGTHGAHLGRGDEVEAMLSGQQLSCLGKTRAGHPSHPLYRKKTEVLRSLE